MLFRSVEAVARGRDGSGPTLIVADTYRYLGHMAGDTEIYRKPDEVQQWRDRDPIARLAATLIEAGALTQEGWLTMQAEVSSEMDAAEQFARNSPFPDATAATTDVYQETVA